MNEVELLKQQVNALEKLISIKDQTISALQSRPYHYSQHPYWYGHNQAYATNQTSQNQYQQQANQCNGSLAQYATNTAGLCSVSGGQS